MYIERYLEASRHTEVQLVCDSHGSGVYFFERDCSVQRRHQKLIEEAPSIHLSDEQRRDIGERAVAGAAVGGLHRRRARWSSCSTDDGNLSFMEMNARIQVEHPGQRDGHELGPDRRSRSAWRRGSRCRSPRTTSILRGHAIECRINAEDPDERLRSGCRHARHVRAAGRPGHAGGLPLLPRLDDRAVLRLADRQADRVGARIATPRSSAWTARCRSSRSRAGA